jgi:DNA-binding CsgD family transcriptional regulator/tetratricopeptide (TPR) repeat protein
VERRSKSAQSLVERDHQLVTLLSAAELAASGTPTLVLITGEAGAGKTRLVSEVVASIRPQFDTLVVEADPTASGPFPGLEMSIAAGTDPAAAIGASLGRELAGRAAVEPLVVVLEDVHLLDPVAVACLAPTVRTLGATPVLILSTFRLGTHPPGSAMARAIADLLRQQWAAEVRVPPLTPDGVAQLAGQLGCRAGDAFLSDLYQRTAGNPFFVEEIVLASRPGEQALPWTVAEVVAARLQTLPQKAAAVADLLAVAGEPEARHIIEDVVDDGAAGTLSLLDASMAVTVPGDQVALRHAVVAEVVIDRMPAVRRRALHLALAHRLEGEPEVAPGRLARHWLEGGRPAMAVPCARQAAEDATAARAYHTATEWYRIAIEHAAPASPPLPELLEHAAVAAGLSGSFADALGFATRADAGYRAAGQAWKAATMWVNPALRFIPKPAVDRGALAADDASSLIAASTMAAWEGRYDESATCAQRAINAAEQAGLDPVWRQRAAYRLIAAGYLEDGDHELDRIQVEAVTTGDRLLLSAVLGVTSEACLARGDLERSLQADLHALELVEEAGRDPWPYRVGVAILRAMAGDLEEASGLIAKLLASDDPLASEFAQHPALLIDLEHNDLASARRRLARMAPVRGLGEPMFTAAVLSDEAKLELLAGDADAAIRTVREARTSGLFDPSRVDLLVVGAKAGQLSGDRDVIDDTCVVLDELVRVGGGPSYRAAADWASGLAATLHGDAAAAIERCQSGAYGFERARRPLFAADAWCDLLEAARTAGNVLAAEHAAKRAWLLAEQHGSARVMARLTDLGVGATGAEAVLTDAHWLSGRGLSPRELEIARLVAEGQTNREIGRRLFLSEHTVRNQLVHVYAKLGVSRRAEIVRLRAGPPSAPR